MCVNQPPTHVILIDGKEWSTAELLKGGSGRKTFKDSILEVCSIREDEIVQQVKIRVQGAVSDLHAADAQYHNDCMAKFMGPRGRIFAHRKSEHHTDECADPAFVKVIHELSNNPTRIWNSVEVYNLYVSLQGIQRKRRTLIENLSTCFGSDLLVLSGVGVASILVFRSKASHLLKIILDDDDDQDDRDIRKVSVRITKETKQLVPDLNSHATEINAVIIRDDCSPTLLHLLSQISPKLGDNLQASLIGNIITSTANHRAIILQVSLGVLMKEKSLIDKCYGFGITCSYDEGLRFKASAAQAASQKEK